MSTAFYVAHRTDDRTRLRLAERLPPERAAEQREALLDVADELRMLLPDQHGLLQIDPRPDTGSIVIEHPHLPADAVAAAVQAAGGTLAEQPTAASRPGLSPLLASVHNADATLRAATDGAADLRTLMFLMLTGLAIAQILRGQIMVPATSLLWYAFDVALHSPAATAAPDHDGGAD